MRGLPIRFRLTLWYSALLAAALATFSITIYLVVANILVSDLDSSLNQRMNHLQQEVAVAHGRISLPHGEEQADQPLIPAILLSPSGRVLLGTVPVDVRAWLTRHPLARLGASTLASAGAIRLLIRPFVQRRHIAGYVLVLGSMAPVDSARHSLLLVLIAACPLLLIVASLGGVALAGRALRPVVDLTHVASSISGHDLRRRVPVGSAHDELSELATTFNAMIDRLQGAVQREKSFTADASHELRSPLAVIRAEATLALEHRRPETAYQQALATIDDQAAAMEDLIAALLMLARLETTSGFEQEPLDVARLVTAAVEQARQSVEQPDVAIACDLAEGLLVEGSEPLLKRAISNVVENALKVSSAGDAIDIRTRLEGTCIGITITDHGPGIATEHQTRIFDPFHQVEQSRTPGSSHGLGLAICRRMVTVHGGEVTVESEPGKGSTFRITLPALQ